MDIDLSGIYFVEEIIVFVTKVDDGKQLPISRTLRNMQDLMNLRREIRDGKFLPYVGDFTLDQQLWFAVAKYSKLVREKGDTPLPTTTPPNAAALEMLEQ